MNESFFRNKVFPSVSFDIIVNPWLIDQATGLWGKLDERGTKIIPYGFAGMNHDAYSLFCDVVFCNSKLYFVPANQDGDAYVKVFDLGTKSEYDIVLKKAEIKKEFEQFYYFSSGYVVGDFVFMFGSSYPAVICIDSKTDEVQYINKWMDIIPTEILRDSEIGYFGFPQCVLMGDELLIPCAIYNGILKYNVKTNKEEFVVIGGIESQGISNLIEHDEGKLLASGCGRNANFVYVIDINNNKVERIISIENSSKKYPIRPMIKDGMGNVYLFPFDNWDHDDMEIYRLNNNTWTIENMRILEKQRGRCTNTDYIWGNEVVYACKKNDEDIVYVTGRDLTWHIYNIIDKTDTCIELNYEIASEDNTLLKKQYIKQLVERKKTISEDDLCVEEFIKIMG